MSLIPMRLSKLFRNYAYENRIRIYLWQPRAILGSMNGKSNSKVTRSESVHYESSAPVFPSDRGDERAARANMCRRMRPSDYCTLVITYREGERLSCRMTLSM